MIRIEMELDQLDCDAVFRVGYRMICQSLSGSEDPVASLLSRVPESIAQTVWNGLSQHQKESVIARLIDGKANELKGVAEEKLRELGIGASVKSVQVTTD